MKVELQPYAMTRNEVRLLRELCNKRLTITKIASILGVTPGLASRLVRDLEKKGFLTDTRKGSSKEIRFSTNLHAQLFSELIKREPDVAWENVLPYSRLGVMMGRIGLSLGANYSRTTRWRAIRDVGAHGQLRERNHILKEFLQAYYDYISRDFASKKLPQDAAVIWRKGLRYLFRVPVGEVVGVGFLPTAISVFPRYGIRLVTKYDYYLYEPAVEHLSVEDHIIHTLLIDPNSSTYSTYAILLLLKTAERVDRSRLTAKAEEYGVREAVQALLDYLDTRGKERSFPLPPYSELLEKAVLYGVKAKWEKEKISTSNI
jgi:DNA-binding Lrp family transcriptional regulator